MVLHSSVLLGVFITVTHHFYCSVERWGGMPFGKAHINVDLNQEGFFSGLMLTPAHFPEWKSTCSLHF